MSWKLSNSVFLKQNFGQISAKFLPTFWFFCTFFIVFCHCLICLGGGGGAWLSIRSQGAETKKPWKKIHYWNWIQHGRIIQKNPREISVAHFWAKFINFQYFSYQNLKKTFILWGVAPPIEEDMARDAIPKVWSRYDQVLAVNNDWKTIHRGYPPHRLMPCFQAGYPPA